MATDSGNKRQNDQRLEAQNIIDGTLEDYTLRLLREVIENICAVTGNMNKRFADEDKGSWIFHVHIVWSH